MMNYLGLKKLVCSLLMLAAFCCSQLEARHIVFKFKVGASGPSDLTLAAGAFFTGGSKKADGNGYNQTLILDFPDGKNEPYSISVYSRGNGRLNHPPGYLTVSIDGGSETEVFLLNNEAPFEHTAGSFIF